MMITVKYPIHQFIERGDQDEDIRSTACPGSGISSGKIQGGLYD